MLIMSELEVLKERISYLKFWQGLLMATNIGLVGWLLSNGISAHPVRKVGGIILAAGLALGTAVLHRRIDSKINELREL